MPKDLKKLERMVTICCAGGYPNWSAYLPTLKVSVLECKYVALLESGCTRSIVLPGLAKLGRTLKAYETTSYNDE